MDKQASTGLGSFFGEWLMVCEIGLTTSMVKQHLDEARALVKWVLQATLR